MKQRGTTSRRRGGTLTSCVASGLFLACAMPLQATEHPTLNGSSATTPAAWNAVTTTPLLVIGFMGGHIRADNMVHREAQVAQSLQHRNRGAVKAITFANHDGALALDTAARFVDTDGDGKLTDGEKRTARIVIYGHSWGASEGVTLARALGRMGIPVLLTIQVDSVQKLGENDRMIPSNVRQAVNFYQAEGLLNGRAIILADDPHRTTILTNERFSYRNAPVNCDQFPWFARTFMKPHIEIENDPALWSRVEAMIQERVDLPRPEMGDGTLR